MKNGLWLTQGRFVRLITLSLRESGGPHDHWSHSIHIGYIFLLPPIERAVTSSIDCIVKITKDLSRTINETVVSNNNAAVRFSVTTHFLLLYLFDCK